MTATSVSAFAVVTALFRSIDESVIAANRLGKAYADGVGKPEFYAPYTASKPETVAMDLAGLYAADSTANCLARLREGRVTEEGYVSALLVISQNCMSDSEKYVAENIANVAWRAGQPFRGMSIKPLDRLTRDINQQFNLLPADQQDKDLVQVVEGAKILLEKIHNVTMATA